MLYSQGSKGDAVTQIQQRLKDLGYYQGIIDGTFDTKTQQAVKNFQLSNGLTADEIAGERTLAALGLVSGGELNKPYTQSTEALNFTGEEKPSNFPYTGYGPAAVSGRTVLQNLNNLSSKGLCFFWIYHNTRILQETNEVNFAGQNGTVPAAVVEDPYSIGSTGDIVAQIQRRLRDLGYYSGNVDGIFGVQTDIAVRNFQLANGLTVDGIVGPATLAVLGISLQERVITLETVTEREVYLLASAIYGEARGEPYEGQVAVAAVILNRVRSPLFPNTIEEVIYQKGAFSAVDDGQIYLIPNEIAFAAARDALGGWDPTEGALYYWNPVTATSKWIWNVPIIMSIGRHVFGNF